MKNSTINYFKTKQAILPLFISDCLNICDPVLVFDRFMEEIDLEKYLSNVPTHVTGRIRYNPTSMLKTILFGFMTNGYISLRELEDCCKVNLRFMYLMDHETPSYRTFGYFIENMLKPSVEELFSDINKKIFAKDHVDLSHLYIDGSKFEANANKYSWVWKKATEKSRYRLFEKITGLLDEINNDLASFGIKIDTNSEYVPAYLSEVTERYAKIYELDETKFVHGKGHRKTPQQRYYERLQQYTAKLEEYVEKITVCGPERNSYSKTDHAATFMRLKTDYMGNDQLLPAYNVQFGIADEYIAVADVTWILDLT
jgi:transposase